MRQEGRRRLLEGGEVGTNRDGRIAGEKGSGLFEGEMESSGITRHFFHLPTYNEVRNVCGLERLPDLASFDRKTRVTLERVYDVFRVRTRRFGTDRE